MKLQVITAWFKPDNHETGIETQQRHTLQVKLGQTPLYLSQIPAESVIRLAEMVINLRRQFVGSRSERLIGLMAKHRLTARQLTIPTPLIGGKLFSIFRQVWSGERGCGKLLRSSRMESGS